jgi:hypothetical protein
MGCVGDKPMTQHNKNFCAAFFKKRPLASGSVALEAILL